MNDDELRIKVKMFKASYNITYKQIAEELGIKQRSIYNWLNGGFEFSDRRKRQLNKYINSKEE